MTTDNDLVKIYENIVSSMFLPPPRRVNRLITNYAH